MKIYIDEICPLIDGTFPLVIEVLYEGQLWKIRTPYHYTYSSSADLPENTNQDGVPWRKMAITDHSLDEVVSSVANVIDSIRLIVPFVESTKV